MTPIPPNCDECAKINTCGSCHLVIATLKVVDMIEAIRKDPDVLRNLSIVVDAQKN